MAFPNDRTWISISTVSMVSQSMLIFPGYVIDRIGSQDGPAAITLLSGVAMTGGYALITATLASLPR